MKSMWEEADGEQGHWPKVPSEKIRIASDLYWIVKYEVYWRHGFSENCYIFSKLVI
jgi:hypothetical protein